MTDEIVGEFVAESYEGLDRMSTDLVALEQDRTNPETLSSIFRTMHTVKGTCGFLGFAKLEAIAHAGEDLLSLIRDGVLEMTPDVVTALLDTSDAMREVLAHVERDVTEGPTTIGSWWHVWRPWPRASGLSPPAQSMTSNGSCGPLRSVPEEVSPARRS